MDIIIWNDDEGRVVAKTPPGGMTAEQAQADAGLVPQDRPSFIVDNANLPSAPLAAWRLDSNGVVSVSAAHQLAAAVLAKGSAIAAAYAAAVARGYEHRGKVIQIDPESRQNIDSMALLARLVLNNVDGAEWPADLAEKGWRTLDNTHLPMTPTQMVSMSFEVANHFVAIRFRASALKDALAAAVAAQDADAIAAIDPSTGWPA